MLLVALLIISILSILIIVLPIIFGWYIVPVIWLSIDLVIVVSGLFAVTYVKSRHPELWKEHFVGEE